MFEIDEELVDPLHQNLQDLLIYLQESRGVKMIVFRARVDDSFAQGVGYRCALKLRKELTHRQTEVLVLLL